METHVIPIGDYREHEDSKDCWCKPKQDEDVWDLWIHNPLDQRDFYERGERRLN